MVKRLTFSGIIAFCCRAPLRSAASEFQLTFILICCLPFQQRRRFYSASATAKSKSTAAPRLNSIWFICMKPASLTDCHHTVYSYVTAYAWVCKLMFTAWLSREYCIIPPEILCVLIRNRAYCVKQSVFISKNKIKSTLGMQISAVSWKYWQLRFTDNNLYLYM